LPIEMMLLKALVVQISKSGQFFKRALEEVVESNLVLRHI